MNDLCLYGCLIKSLLLLLLFSCLFVFQWREVARELEGVIRIGAVNCGDELMLCRQQGIRSYPSLIVFPQVNQMDGILTLQYLFQMY